MRVTRITLDADLGLIELKTGPGGDGDYVLLPLEVPPTVRRLLSMGDTTAPEAPDEEAPLIAVGGWSTPTDRAPELDGWSENSASEMRNPTEKCDGNCGAHRVKKLPVKCRVCGLGHHSSYCGG